MGDDIKRVNAYNPVTGQNAVAIMNVTLGIIKFAGGLVIAIPMAIINKVFKHKGTQPE